MQSFAGSAMTGALRLTFNTIRKASGVGNATQLRALMLISLFMQALFLFVVGWIMLIYLYRVVRRIFNISVPKAASNAETATDTSVAVATFGTLVFGASILDGGFSGAKTTASTLISLSSIIVISFACSGAAMAVFQFSDTVFPALQNADRGFVRVIADNIVNPVVALGLAGWQTAYGGMILMSRLASAFFRLPFKIALVVILDSLGDIFALSVEALTALMSALVFYLQNGVFTGVIPLQTFFNRIGRLTTLLWDEVVVVLLKAANYVFYGIAAAASEPSFAIALQEFSTLFYRPIFTIVINPILYGTRPVIAPTAGAVNTALIETGRFLQNATTHQFNLWIYGNDTTLISYVEGTIPVPPGDDIIYLVRFLRSDWAVAASLAVCTVLGLFFQAIDVAFNIDIVFSPVGNTVFTFDYIREPALACVSAVVSIFTVLPSCNTNPPTFTNINFGQLLNLARAVIFLVSALLNIAIGEFYTLVNDPLSALGVYTATYLRQPNNYFSSYINELTLASNALGCTIGLIEPAVGNAIAGFITTVLGTLPHSVLQIIAFLRFAIRYPANADVMTSVNFDSLAQSLTQVGKIGEIFFSFEPGANAQTCVTRVSAMCGLGSGLTNLTASWITLMTIVLKSITYLIRNTVQFFSGIPVSPQPYTPDYRGTVELAYNGACRVGIALGTVTYIGLSCMQAKAPNLCRVREYPVVEGRVDYCLGTLICKLTAIPVSLVDMFAILVQLVNTFSFTNSNSVISALKEMTNIVIFRWLSFVCPLAHFFDCVLDVLLPADTDPVVSNFICLIMSFVVFLYITLTDILIKLADVVINFLMLIFGGGGQDPARTLLNVIIGFLEIIGASIGQLLLAILNLALAVFFGLVVAVCYIISPFTFFLLVPKCKELADSVFGSLGQGAFGFLNNPDYINYKKRMEYNQEHSNESNPTKRFSDFMDGSPTFGFNFTAFLIERERILNDPPSMCDAANNMIENLARKYMARALDSAKSGIEGIFKYEVLEDFITDANARGARRRAQRSAPWESTVRGWESNNGDHAVRRSTEQDQAVKAFGDVARERVRKEREARYTATEQILYNNFMKAYPEEMAKQGHVDSKDTRSRKRFTREYFRVDDDEEDEHDPATGNITHAVNHLFYPSIKLELFGAGPESVGLQPSQIPQYLADFVPWDSTSMCGEFFKNARSLEWQDMTPADKTIAWGCVMLRGITGFASRTIKIFSWMPDNFFDNAPVSWLIAGIQGTQFAKVALQWIMDRVMPYELLFSIDYQRQWIDSSVLANHYENEWRQFYPGPNALPTDYVLLASAIENRTLSIYLRENYPLLYTNSPLNTTDILNDPILGPVYMMQQFVGSISTDIFGTLYETSENVLNADEASHYGVPYLSSVQYIHHPNYTNVTDLYSTYGEDILKLYNTRIHTINMFESFSSFVVGAVQWGELWYNIAIGAESNILGNFKRSFDRVYDTTMSLPERLPQVYKMLQKNYGSVADDLLDVHGAIGYIHLADQHDTEEVRRRRHSEYHEKQPTRPAVRVLAYSAHSLIELVSSIAQLPRNKTAPMCIQLISRDQNITYKEAELLAMDPVLGPELRLKCANETWRMALSDFTRISPEIAAIFNDPKGFANRIFGPRTPSAKIVQDRVYGAIGGSMGIFSDLAFVIAGDGILSDRVERVFVKGEHAPENFSLFGALKENTITNAVARSSRSIAARVSRFIDVVKDMPLAGIRSEQALNEGRYPTSAETEDDYQDFLKRKHINIGNHSKRPAAIRDLAGELSHGTKVNRKDAAFAGYKYTTTLSNEEVKSKLHESPMYRQQLKSRARNWEAANSHDQSASAAEIRSRLKVKLEAVEANHAKTTSDSWIASDVLSEALLEAIGIANQVGESAQELAYIIADREAIQDRTWVASLTQSFAIPEPEVSFKPRSKMYSSSETSQQNNLHARRRITLKVNRPSSRETPSANMFPADIIIDSHSVIPINVSDFFDLTCYADVPVLCEYFYAPTLIAYSGLTSFTLVSAYYTILFPPTTGYFLAVIVYSTDQNAIVVSGNGENPPWLWDPYVSNGDYFQLWPSEIANGIDYTAWIEEITGPFPPMSVNGSLYSAVVQYDQLRQEASDMGLTYPYNPIYSVLSFIQFTIQVPLIDWLDTIFTGFSGRISEIIANIADRTIFCTYTTEIDCSRQMYSASGGMLVTAVALGVVALIVAFVAQIAGFSFIWGIIVVLPFSIPLYLVITYNWSVRCIVPPACLAEQLYSLYAFTLAPKCNAIYGSAITTPGYNAATCYDPAATYEYVVCPDIIRNLPDVLTYFQLIHGFGQNILDFIAWPYSVFFGPPDPTQDWSQLPWNTDSVLARTLGLCSTVGAFVYGPATIGAAAVSASILLGTITFGWAAIIAVGVWVISWAYALMNLFQEAAANLGRAGTVEAINAVRARKRREEEEALWEIGGEQMEANDQQLDEELNSITITPEEMQAAMDTSFEPASTIRRRNTQRRPPAPPSQQQRHYHQHTYTRPSPTTQLIHMAQRGTAAFGDIMRSANGWIPGRTNKQS